MSLFGERSSVFGTCCVQLGDSDRSWKSCCGQRMEAAHEPYRGEKFFRTSRLLQEIYREVFHYCSTHDQVDLQECEVLMDRWLWESFPRVKAAVDYSTDVNYTSTKGKVSSVYWCEWNWVGMCVDVTSEGCILRLMIVKTSWETIPYSWLRVGSSCFCIESVATLLVWGVL